MSMKWLLLRKRTFFRFCLNFSVPFSLEEHFSQITLAISVPQWELCVCVLGGTERGYCVNWANPWGVGRDRTMPTLFVNSEEWASAHTCAHTQQFLSGPLVVAQPVDHLQPQKTAQLHKTQVFSCSSRPKFFWQVMLENKWHQILKKALNILYFLLFSDIHKEVWSVSLI